MRDRNPDERKRNDGEKVAARRKIRFTDPQKQSRMIEGVSVAIWNDGIPDYDDLLREALRVALQTDMNPTHDDWPDIYKRICGLMDAYIHSPDGAGQDACMHLDDSARGMRRRCHPDGGAEKALLGAPCAPSSPIEGHG
jgi:hypothetical protein